MSKYEMSLYQIIGEMIREKRIAAGLTLEDVAIKINVTPKTLQRYETGERKIKLDTIMELSQILFFDYDTFMAEAKRRLAANSNESDIEVDASSTYGKYYIDEEIRKIAQEIFEDTDMKLLFDVKRSVKGQELINYAKYLKEQYERENGL